MKFLDDRYEVIQDAEVFFGGQAKVFQCVDTFSSETVAVKVTNLSTSLMARTHERDVKSLKRLSHDNIIELLDWGAENNQGIVVLDATKYPEYPVRSEMSRKLNVAETVVLPYPFPKEITVLQSFES